MHQPMPTLKPELLTEEEFERIFPTELRCRKALYAIKWPQGFVCPNCGHRHATLNERKQYRCGKCGKGTSLKANTLMHKSRLGLKQWFLAIFLICLSIDGISARQLAQRIDVSRKTAWLLGHKIRKAMEDPLAKSPLVEGVRFGSFSLAGVVDPTPWLDTAAGNPTQRRNRKRSRPSAPRVVVAVETSASTPGTRIQDEATIPKRVVVAVDEPTRAPTTGDPHDPLEHAVVPGTDFSHDDTSAMVLAWSAVRFRQWLASVYRCAVGRHLRRYGDEYGYRFNQFIRQECEALDVLAEILAQAMRKGPFTYDMLVHDPAVGVPPRAVPGRSGPFPRAARESVAILETA